MKFYFLSSLNGNYRNYKLLIDLIVQQGHDLLNELPQIEDREKIRAKRLGEAKKYAKSMLRDLKKASFIVAEVTKPSFNVGYGIMLALQKAKPVIALFDKTKVESPYTLEGLKNERLQVFGYDPNSKEDLSSLLEMSVEEAIARMDTRFNFFISPQQQAFLDWISKERKIPRSVFLRKLIEAHMSDNENYPNGV